MNLDLYVSKSMDMAGVQTYVIAVRASLRINCALSGLWGSSTEVWRSKGWRSRRYVLKPRRKARTDPREGMAGCLVVFEW